MCGRAARRDQSLVGEIFRGRNCHSLVHSTYLYHSERGLTRALPNRGRPSRPQTRHDGSSQPRPAVLFARFHGSLRTTRRLAPSTAEPPSQVRRARSEGRGGGQNGVRVRDRMGRKRLECSGSARTGAPPREYSICPLWAVGRSADREEWRGGLDVSSGSVISGCNQRIVAGSICNDHSSMVARLACVKG